MIREEIKNLMEEAVKNLQKGGVFPEFKIPEILVERPEKSENGDYATNIAMALARFVKKGPMEIAELVSKSVSQQVSKSFFGKIEIAPQGFINFFVSKEYLQKQVGGILRGKVYSLKFSKRKLGRVNVEFISANPTGPLTLGNGRGGFCGDVLANILEKAGFGVEREYYINDVGEQIRKLGHSVLGDSEAVYNGEYIKEVRKKLGSAFAKASADKIGGKAAKIILKEMIKPAVKKMGINFDVWFSEKNLYKNKEVEKALAFLKKKKLTYEKDGALWFVSTKFGDDKDRVLIKADGEKTYLASDIAYLENKFKRGFKKLIFFWGADHYGYIARLKAAAEALGYKKEQINIIIMQLVRLIENGKEVRMSKREGIYITIDELIDEVGLDIARFFFLTRANDSQLNFDLDLAKEQSEKNPVYYIQYAYARICSISRKFGKSEIRLARNASHSDAGGNPPTESRVLDKVGTKSETLKLLTHQSELALIKQLIRLPEIIEDIAKDYQVQRLPQYATDLAMAFHQFYRDCHVISEDKNLTAARLALISATKIVLKNTLDLMGISSPEKM